MTDFALAIVNDEIQPVLVDGDLLGDEGLETSVLVSLFTDRRVTLGELPPNQTDLGGWWADSFLTEGDFTGSKLWLILSEKTNEQALAKIETYIAEALQWMIDDGVATSISAVASFDQNRNTLMEIKITKPQGDEPDVFSLIWDGQELKRNGI